MEVQEITGIEFAKGSEDGYVRHHAPSTCEVRVFDSIAAQRGLDFGRLGHVGNRSYVEIERGKYRYRDRAGY